MEISPALCSRACPVKASNRGLPSQAKRMSAGEICEPFAITDAAISRHLSVLKEADLVRDTREGKFIFYELNASVLEEILLWVKDLKGEESND